MELSDIFNHLNNLVYEKFPDGYKLKNNRESRSFICNKLTSELDKLIENGIIMNYLTICDETNNTSSDINEGIIKCQVFYDDTISSLYEYLYHFTVPKYIIWNQKIDKIVDENRTI